MPLCHQTSTYYYNYYIAFDSELSGYTNSNMVISDGCKQTLSYLLVNSYGLIIIHITALDYCHSQTRAVACT